MTKVLQHGLIGKLFGIGQKKSGDSVAKQRAESRNLQKISNDRAKGQLQADGARKTGSRRAKRGRRLLNEKRTTVG